MPATIRRFFYGLRPSFNPYGAFGNRGVAIDGRDAKRPAAGEMRRAPTPDPSMTLPLTLALLIIGAVSTALFGWLGARPLQPGKPRMVPWQILMMFAAAWCIMMVVHLLTLVGIHTGGNGGGVQP